MNACDTKKIVKKEKAQYLSDDGNDCKSSMILDSVEGCRTDLSATSMGSGQSPFLLSPDEENRGRSWGSKTKEVFSMKCSSEEPSNMSLSSWFEEPSNMSVSSNTSSLNLCDSFRRVIKMDCNMSTNSPLCSRTSQQKTNAPRPEAPVSVAKTATVSLGAVETLYAKEIINYLIKKQKERQKCIPSVASLGSLARGDYRAILVSWLIQVHDYEQLEKETLFLTVRITDTYCSAADVELGSVQLVGIAAIFIASKLEERFPPEGKDLIRYTSNAYSLEELYKMELSILSKLEFEVNLPISTAFATFLLMIAEKSEKHNKVNLLTDYLLELSLISKPLISVAPSLVAAAAVFMSRSLLIESEDPWPSFLAASSTYKVSALRPVAAELINILQSTPESRFNSSYLKYSSEAHYQSLSKLPVLQNSIALKRLSLACKSTVSVTNGSICES